MSEADRDRIAREHPELVKDVDALQPLSAVTFADPRAKAAIQTMQSMGSMLGLDSVVVAASTYLMAQAVTLDGLVKELGKPESPDILDAVELAIPQLEATLKHMKSAFELARSNGHKTMDEWVAEEEAKEAAEAKAPEGSVPL